MSVREQLTPFLSAAPSHEHNLPILLLHSLNSSNVSDGGVAAIEEALKHNQILTKLKYVSQKARSFPICSVSLSAGPVGHPDLIFRLMRSLADNRIGAEGAAAIAEVLKHNKTLGVLK